MLFNNFLFVFIRTNLTPKKYTKKKFTKIYEDTKNEIVNSAYFVVFKINQCVSHMFPSLRWAVSLNIWPCRFWSQVNWIRRRQSKLKKKDSSHNYSHNKKIKTFDKSFTIAVGWICLRRATCELHTFFNEGYAHE